MADNHMDDAWHAIQAYDGPDAAELLYFFAVNAQNQAYDTRDESERYGLVDLGLEAVDRELALRPDDPDALSAKCGLLRHKASGMSDEDEETHALWDEADRLERRAAELRMKKQPKKGA
jgi:hypothetical protein